MMEYATGGWLGPVRHTYTQLCDGAHSDGPCPAPPVTQRHQLATTVTMARLSDDDVDRIAKQVMADLARRAKIN